MDHCRHLLNSYNASSRWCQKASKLNEVTNPYSLLVTDHLTVHFIISVQTALEKNENGLKFNLFRAKFILISYDMWKGFYLT